MEIAHYPVMAARYKTKEVVEAELYSRAWREEILDSIIEILEEENAVPGNEVESG